MKNKQKILRNLAISVVFLIVMFLVFSRFFIANNIERFTYSRFANDYSKFKFQELEADVKSTVIHISGIYQHPESRKDTRFLTTLPNTDDAHRILKDISTKTTIVYADALEKEGLARLIIQYIPFMIVTILAYVAASRLGGMNNKALDFTNRNKMQLQKNVKVRFADVAGCDEEKEEIAEIVDYLRNPGRFTESGARVPKGVLMEGPPGTGKTLLAKAIAGEAKVPFYSVSGSDFVEMFVGTGASRVREMMKEARKNIPCIIFIDEIDAIGKRRSGGFSGGDSEREQTLNQLLVEMDGMSGGGEIIVIAATNRAEVLDPALKRSGRFDRIIRVALPDKKAREAILRVHARNKKLEPGIEFTHIAKRTPGFSGADLENVLNEAAILSVRDNRKEISLKDLDEAIDRVMMGPAKKSKKYSEEERRIVAYHEAGHAVVGLKVENASVVQKVTIIPRGSAGGYNLMMPEEERFFPTYSYFLAEIAVSMGGRVAEEIWFKDISAGASNDIEKATRIARAMVHEYGMSSLGPIQYSSVKDASNFGTTAYGEYSELTAQRLDQEIKNIMDQGYLRAKEIISENRELLKLIAETLLEEETITAEQIQSLATRGTL